MDTTLHQELKTALEKERETLVRELKSLARENPHIKGAWDTRFPQFETDEAGSHSSMDEEADEVEEYGTALATEESLKSRLGEVSNALESMEKGTYGMCMTCKKPIPLLRLKANPAAAYDMEHAEKNL